ncbi:MAG: arsenic transporter, partial [Firmicutes bacterium]|nr:arsenic transporter [Candidatus Caballimonas caccae]
MIYFILCLFILTYVLIIAKPTLKVYFTGISALIASVTLLISKDIVFMDILFNIDFNVILMLLGIMLTVGVFSESNMPNLIAEKIMSKINSSTVAVVLLSVLSGIISAFVDNVATVLMLAPIGIAIAKKVKISPIPVIIGIAVSSNLQGAATLVGDTTSIMLASSAKMSFADFFFIDGKPSIFWAVEIGAVLTVPVFFILFRKDNKKMQYEGEMVYVSSIIPTILLSLNMITLIAISFIKDKFELLNGIICIGFGLI